jgi:hypothetical protein
MKPYSAAKSDREIVSSIVKELGLKGAYTDPTEAISAWACGIDPPASPMALDWLKARSA